MRRWRSTANWALRLVTLSALLARTTYAASGFDAATAASLRAVITQQIEALSRDDGTAAEGFAAPAIRERFPDPAQFLAMVRTHYAALIRPRTTQFTSIEASASGPLQKVTVVAADGTVWSAVYSFTQVDSQWRITGCTLEKDDSQQAI